MPVAEEEAAAAAHRAAAPHAALLAATCTLDDRARRLQSHPPRTLAQADGTTARRPWTAAAAGRHRPGRALQLHGRLLVARGSDTLGEVHRHALACTSAAPHAAAGVAWASRSGGASAFAAAAGTAGGPAVVPAQLPAAVFAPDLLAVRAAAARHAAEPMAVQDAVETGPAKGSPCCWW